MNGRYAAAIAAPKALALWEHLTDFRLAVQYYHLLTIIYHLLNNEK
jgi:hypothetical protein